jgi:type II secretion system protein G
MKHHISRDRKGFTLIELLIVIAIILILIAIALPNFLEAQIRAKVTRNYSEFKGLAIALEMYRGDYRNYPGNNKVTRGLKDELLSRYTELTTPSAYIKTIPVDPFGQEEWVYPIKHGSYIYCGGWWQSVAGGGGLRFLGNWVLVGKGPDTLDGNGEWATVRSIPEGDRLRFFYSPTNGTVSIGDMVRWGPS